MRANSPNALGDTGFVGSGGDIYWFPRQDTKPGENQLVIIGGGREGQDEAEFHTIDDSTVSPFVSRVQRNFLPGVFPGKFDVREPEMEWVCGWPACL